MKIVLSPAKSLDFDKKVTTNQFSEAVFLKESATINKVLKKKTPKTLSKLMGISDKLAELNWQRNQEWNLPFDLENARQAVFAFDGDVYHGLDAYSLPLEKIAGLQEKLRILSGLYGLLKPLDLIQPYRLEMGTSLSIGKNKNLYEFWKKSITNSLNKELEDNELFVNLASNEYFHAVDVKSLKVPVITPEFKEFKDGQYKTISFFAKKARGMMVRYIVDANANTIEDLKGFDCEGYSFDEKLSNGTKLTFVR